MRTSPRSILFQPAETISRITDKLIEEIHEVNRLGLRGGSDSAQCTAIRYAERVTGAGVLASIGAVGDSYDAIDSPFRTADELALATLDWTHWFNANRIRSSIGLSRTTRDRTVVP